MRADHRRRGSALALTLALGALAAPAAAAAQQCTITANPSFPSAPVYGASYAWLQQLRIPEVHALGFTGKGVRIAILDSGFETQHESLTPLRVMATRDFIHNDQVVRNEAGDSVRPIDPERHGTEVFSLVGACDPGALVGPAFDAEFYLAKVDETNPQLDYREDELRWVAAARWADSLSADILLSSLGYREFLDGTVYGFEAMNGDSLPSTRAADEAARGGVLVVKSAGNRGPGPGTLTAPADADSIIAVGAVDSVGTVLSFSSRGPTADGRIKPELVARGINLVGADADDLDGYRLLAFGGTSYAAPLIAGAAALVMEAWPDLSIMAIRRALILSADQANRPDNNRGYGIPDVLSAISFPEGISTFRVTGTDAQGTFETLSPTFRWQVPLVHPTARPVRYFLELGADSAFSRVIYRDSITDAFAAPLKEALRPAEGIYWRVVAVAGNSATRVSTRSGPLRMPDWVRLVSLNSTSGNFVDAPRPTFTFRALPAPSPIGPLAFDVQVIDPESRAVVSSVTTQDTVATLETPLAFNVPYRWRVIARSPRGVADTTESVAPFVVVSTMAPPATLLYQNFPNPFPGSGATDGSTQLWFDLAERGTVQLAVYDLRGRLIRRLIPQPGCTGVELEAGIYGRQRAGESDSCVLTRWDGRADDGSAVPAGVYLIRLRAGSVERVVRALYLPR